jgi:hypothetical protein
MAIPGDTACHEPAPCSGGKYGNAPIGANTIFVDASYSGPSDGSMSKPWKSIQGAVDAAPADTVIAIAAGKYMEFVLMQVPRVTLWGACPGAVELHGTLADSGAVEIHGKGTEVHDLSITGVAFGVAALNAGDVLLENLWVHDTPLIGVQVLNSPSPGVTLRSSLVEGAGASGLDARGAVVNVDSSHIRGTVLYNNGDGHGISALNQDKKNAQLTVTNCLIEENATTGIYAANSDVTVDAVVVRDTKGSSSTGGGWGRGIRVLTDSESAAPASLSLKRSVFDRNHTAGIDVEGVSFEIDATTVRGTEALSAMDFAAGVLVDYQPASKRGADGTMERCAIIGNSGGGLSIASSTVQVTATLIRDVHPGGATFGWGIEIDNPEGGTSLQLDQSVVDGATGFGIIASGAKLTVTSSVVRNTHASSDGSLNSGIGVTEYPEGQRASLTIQSSVIENNPDLGVAAYGSDVVISSSEIRSTNASHPGAVGDGVSLLLGLAPTKAQIVDTRIESSTRTGISIFGSILTVAGDALTCNGFDIDTVEEDGFSVSVAGDGEHPCSSGCPSLTGECHSQSTSISPPTPLPPPSMKPSP